MTLNSLTEVQGGLQYPSHSVRCFDSPMHQCRECSDLLGPYPVTQWRDLYARHQYVKRRGVEPLVKDFLDRLMEAMLDEPDEWGEIIRYLHSYERKDL